MKKTPSFFAKKKILSFIATLVFLMNGTQLAFAKLPIVSREKWGANESITVEKPTTVEADTATDTISADKTEKDIDKSADFGKNDPDIQKVVETDPKTGEALRWPLQYAKKILYIVVHNTAISTNLDQPMNQLQSIYTAHSNKRGWGDIGYNYLIDQKGTIYEGRKGGEKVIAGHARPVNKVSIGISLIGNYEEAQTTTQMVNTLVRLIDEKTRLYKINPKGVSAYKGKSFNNIMGHYENDATLCPGIYMKQALPVIRDLVDYYQHFYENGDKKGFSLIKKPEVVSLKQNKSDTFIIRIRNTDISSWNKNTYLENTSETSLPVKIGTIDGFTAVSDLAAFSVVIPAQSTSKLIMPKLRIVANGTRKSNYVFPFPVLVEGVNIPVRPPTPKVLSPKIGDAKTTATAGQKTVKKTKTNVRVRLTDICTQYQYQLSSTDGLMLLNAQNKAKIRIAPNTVVTVRAKAKTGYQLSYDGYLLSSSTPPRFASQKTGGVVTVKNFEKRPSWNIELNDNQFRGSIEVRRENGAMYVINDLSLEDYMKGLAEVPNADELEKAKALAIAARSYAAYYRDVGEKFPGKPYDLDDNPDHTQKYLGYGFEVRSAVALRAVEETKDAILTYQGKQVITPYFNKSDGQTRSAAEVWRWTNAPYLVGVPDSFCGSTALAGHGVGLSGCGATALAKAGKTAEEILKYYYTGITIEKMSQK